MQLVSLADLIADIRSTATPNELEELSDELLRHAETLKAHACSFMRFSEP